MANIGLYIVEKLIQRLATVGALFHKCMNVNEGEDLSCPTWCECLHVMFVARRHHCHKVGKGNGNGRGLLG
jgi:hypothetical protein